MDILPNPLEPGSPTDLNNCSTPTTSLLTVNQTYEYLIAEGLPRSKKTIRKWCRLNHVEKTQNVIAGGPKWLITRSSLDARIAEERLIGASLTQGTGSHGSEAVPGQTGANPSIQVRDDDLVEMLKQQLDHERNARKAIEDQNRDLIRMYHEISMASTQLGIEISKGMQEQGKARQLESERNSSQSHDIAAPARTVAPEAPDQSPAPVANATIEDATIEDATVVGATVVGGDNEALRIRYLRVQ